MPVLPYSFGELKFMFGTYMFDYLIILIATSQMYKNWRMHDLNSARTGACIIQNQKEWRSRKLNHKTVTVRPKNDVTRSKQRVP